MPTGALHSHYWGGSVNPSSPPQTGASSAGGYVPWQTTVVLGGGFGVTQVVWEWLCDRFEWRAAQNKGRT
jgi:hypothetical protein